MKKIFYITIIGLLAIASCAKETVSTADNNTPVKIVLKANIENSVTKATLSGDSSPLTFEWSSTDKVGLVVSNGDSNWCTNQECTTEESGSSVTFSSTTSYSESDKWDIAAFYPYSITVSDGTKYNGIPDPGNDKNAYLQKLTFHMPDGIYGYTSGQVLLPMVAKMSDQGTTHPTNMSFKYLGGGVMLTIPNMPQGAHSIGMRVKGQKVTGDYTGIVADNAGTATLAQENSDTNNEVWLNFDALDATGPFTAIFPVPLLNTPKIAFKIYDENNICGWSVSLATQDESIGRADIMSFNSGTISYDYFAGFTSSSIWSVCGSFTGWGASNDIEMKKHPSKNQYVAEGVNLEANSAFKIRLNHAWDESYPNGDYVVPVTGQYDILFDSDTHKVTLSTHGSFPRFN